VGCHLTVPCPPRGATDAAGWVELHQRTPLRRPRRRAVETARSSATSHERALSRSRRASGMWTATGCVPREGVRSYRRSAAWRCETATGRFPLQRVGTAVSRLDNFSPCKSASNPQDWVFRAHDSQGERGLHSRQDGRRSWWKQIHRCVGPPRVRHPGRLPLWPSTYVQCVILIVSYQ
jgi:hypothetical protein